MSAVEPATCDPDTRALAYEICGTINDGSGCICRRNDNGPCVRMVLAACAAARIVESQQTSSV